MMSVSKFGPGYSGASQSSPMQDPKLPSRVNQGSPGFNNPAQPLHCGNETGKGSTAGVPDPSKMNKPGKGTRGRAPGPVNLPI